jgi:hypothetical protein
MSVRRSSADAGLLQEGWLRLGSQARFRRLNGAVARVTQVVVGAPLDGTGEARYLPGINQEREQHR